VISAGIVYVLCAVTSLLCTVLLWRSWRRSGARLLRWSAACFACFTANNAVLFLDVVVWPDLDLSLARTALGLLGAVLLLFGMIWERR
jgi:hypothetical protein